MANIALFLHNPYCSTDCMEGIQTSLQPNHKVTVFGIDELTSSFLQNYDLVAFPGGMGDVDKFGNLFHWRKAVALEQYIKSGGKYLGICMGAYWAGPEYFDLLDNIEPVQYIKQPGAVVRRSYGTVVPVVWNYKVEHMYFYDGCSFKGDMSNTDVVAVYPTGEPAAIIQGNIGVIGPHPESSKQWFDRSKWSYMPKYWHEGNHNKMLNKFVGKLLK